MGIVTRTTTYPDGTVKVEEVNMDKRTSTKRVSKPDDSKSKPKAARKSVQNSYTTASSSE
jgi:hypothetical protein